MQFWSIMTLLAFAPFALTAPLPNAGAILPRESAPEAAPLDNRAAVSFLQMRGCT